MKRKEQYSSPFVRMWTGNFRRRRGLGEPPVLPMSYQKEKTDSQQDFYGEEPAFGGVLSRVAGSFLGVVLMIIGGYSSLFPKATRSRAGEVSAAQNALAGVFAVFLGIGLLWFCWLRHLGRGTGEPEQPDGTDGEL